MPNGGWTGLELTDGKVNNMSMRRMICVSGSLLTWAAMTVALPGCGGGGSGEVSPTGEVKPVMAPTYTGGAVSEEGPGAGTAAKTASGGSQRRDRNPRRGPGRGRPGKRLREVLTETYTWRFASADDGDGAGRR